MRRRIANLYKPQRNNYFKQLSDADVSYFKSLCSIQTLDLTNFNTDYIGIYKGKSSLVLKPSTIGSIQSIIKYCNEQRLGICIQGGNTGLVGGSVPVHDEIILSLSSLNSIISIDEEEGLIKTQSGVILDKIANACDEKGLVVPLDLGAKGSCMIGGNAATNAGGNRLIRYKSLKENIKHLQIVSGKGDIINSNDSLMQIFIGSEGSLGIITEILLQVPKKEKNSNLALLTCNSFDNVLATLSIAHKRLFEILSAYEFLDSSSYKLTSEYIPSFSPFFSFLSPFYILVETKGANSSHDLDKLEGFLEESLRYSITNGIIATDLKHFKAIWNLRENCGPAAARYGLCLKYDISTPLNEYYKIVEKVRNVVGDRGVTIGFGHVADGNVHINIAVNQKNEFGNVKMMVEKFLYQELQRIGGSISAEHGIGLQKVNSLGYSRSIEEINIMVMNI